MLGNYFLLSVTAALAFLTEVRADHHLIVGAPVPPGDDVPLRLSVNDLQAAAGPQWDLYVQALRAMQDMDSDDKLSYFQTAGMLMSVYAAAEGVYADPLRPGIHGMPYVQWDNAGPRQGSQWLGYCPHGVSFGSSCFVEQSRKIAKLTIIQEPLFLPWHRPYVLLFEEQLLQHATGIAEAYPESVRDQYVAAAKSLRAPYWDWAADNAVPPASVPDTLTINVASGDDVQSSTVSNPLQTYNLPRAALNGRYGTFDRYGRPQTIRCPGPYDSYPYSANNNLRNRNLKGNLVSNLDLSIRHDELIDRLQYAAFVYARDFNQFAMTANHGVGLEQIHNWIHGDASCGQQFWQPDLSGFDPLL